MVVLGFIISEKLEKLIVTLGTLILAIVFEASLQWHFDLLQSEKNLKKKHFDGWIS